MYYYSIQVGEQFSNVSLVEVSFQLAKIYWLTWAVLQISIPEKTQFSLDRNCGSHHMHNSVPASLCTCVFSETSATMREWHQQNNLRSEAQSCSDANIFKMIASWLKTKTLLMPLLLESLRKGWNRRRQLTWPESPPPSDSSQQLLPSPLLFIPGDKGNSRLGLATFLFL